jgi:hypothetical protein
MNLSLLQFPFSTVIAAITDKNEISILQTIIIVESPRERSNITERITLYALGG